MEAILNSFKTENNILLGVCDASRMDYLLPLVTAAETPFVSRDIERRLDPRAVMDAAESIIVIGVGYCAVAEPADDIPRGRLAAIAMQADYHVTVIRLLTALAGRMLKERVFRYKIFADAGHLNERALAARAGLGFIGRNGHVISREFGSFFNIGYMLTDLALAPNAEIQPDACGECSRCADACIGGALNGRFAPRKCVSYLTQKKEPPTPDEAAAMSGWLYGCDVCQNVCPFNAHVRRIPGELYPALDECADITDEQFDEKYRGGALYWRGAEVFRRNAAIAADWYNKTPTWEE